VEKKVFFEIAVTNKKSDIDIQAFIASSLDVIEIDLSSLSWDASITQITFALFKQYNNRQFISHRIMKQKHEWIAKELVLKW
jgi:hypothetical protein